MIAYERSRNLTELMGRSLAGYAGGDINLSELVSDLGTLIDSLDECADQEWVGELRSMWWQLEVVNALTLDEQRHDLTEEEQLAVKDAVDGLAAMITQYS